MLLAWLLTSWVSWAPALVPKVGVPGTLGRSPYKQKATKANWSPRQELRGRLNLEGLSGFHVVLWGVEE
jgi:hypothetical protein